MTYADYGLSCMHPMLSNANWVRIIFQSSQGPTTFNLFWKKCNCSRWTRTGLALYCVPLNNTHKTCILTCSVVVLLEVHTRLLSATPLTAVTAADWIWSRAAQTSDTDPFFLSFLACSSAASLRRFSRRSLNSLSRCCSNSSIIAGFRTTVTNQQWYLISTSYN